VERKKNSEENKLVGKKTKEKRRKNKSRIREG